MCIAALLLRMGISVKLLDFRPFFGENVMIRIALHEL